MSESERKGTLYRHGKETVLEPRRKKEKARAGHGTKKEGNPVRGPEGGPFGGKRDSRWRSCGFHASCRHKRGLTDEACFGEKFTPNTKRGVQKSQGKNPMLQEGEQAVADQTPLFRLEGPPHSAHKKKQIQAFGEKKSTVIRKKKGETRKKGSVFLQHIQEKKEPGLPANGN